MGALKHFLNGSSQTKADRRLTRNWYERVLVLHQPMQDKKYHNFNRRQSDDVCEYVKSDHIYYMNVFVYF